MATKYVTVGSPGFRILGVPPCPERMVITGTCIWYSCALWKDHEGACVYVAHVPQEEGE